MTLDEKALRKPGFTEGPRVKLGDGQEWTFPRPMLRLYPQRGEDGKVVLGGGHSYGVEHEDTLELLISTDNTMERITAQHELAGNLLLRNYDLDNKALRRVLPLEFSEEADNDFWVEVNNVLMGTTGPKPSPDGSDSPSSPTG
ncbi:hypothetical protein [Singulisphaera sp. PoT]|uniref:hypothetical protein n=1 Tax=Singulisphaera sp. PoT TaxID=3411797 RepID=UPI003BF46B19